MSDGICNAAADRWRSDAAADHAPPAAGPAALRYPVLPVVSPAAGVVLLTLALVAMAADSQNRYAIKSAQHLANSALRAEVERLEGFRSEEHTSELQSLMRISYAVFSLKKKKKGKKTHYQNHKWT